MIDPHVHLRDWNQSAKETLRHGLAVAFRAGLDGVFEMPNTDPPLTSREALLRRIDDADAALRDLGIALFHGMYAGVTSAPRQMEDMVRACRDLAPRVVGLKLFAGHSTGSMGVVDPSEQALVYRTLSTLGYTGVLAVHCEKESLVRASEWDPSRPSSHGRARPPASEVASVDDQKTMAREAGFRGILHVCHVSTPWAVDLLRGANDPAGKGALRVTCGVTPHHALLDVQMMDEPLRGLLLKVNPPLRPAPMPAILMRKLLNGEIDWIESDHAPHTRTDKMEGFASGVPGFPFYPRFVKLLSGRGMGAARLRELTHGAICQAFDVEVPVSGRSPETGLEKEYDFDAFESLSTGAAAP